MLQNKTVQLVQQISMHCCLNPSFISRHLSALICVPLLIVSKKSEVPLTSMIAIEPDMATCD